MHKNQKQRLIQQICSVLHISQPAVSTVLHFYRKFTQATSITDTQYSNQVIVGACIFLTAKIFEDQHKIRDILNAIYSVTKLYQLGKAQQQDNSNYIYLNKIVTKNSNKQELLAAIQPAYDLQMYTKLKKQMLQAQQMLLKIIKFDFSIAQQKSSNYKQLLAVCDQLRLTRQVIQIAINIYNDLQFSQDVIQWVPGLLYFAIQVFDVHQQEQATIKQQTQKQQQYPQYRKQQQQKYRHRQQLAIQQKQKQININMNKQITNIDWQKLFLVPIKKLQVYSQKILSYYQMLGLQEKQVVYSQVQLQSQQYNRNS